jgi:hypothetical protein
LSVERIALRLVGVGPMLMHSARLADPLDPMTKMLATVTSKAVKTEADHARISELEWHGGLWLHDGRPCIPPQCVKAVLVDGARKCKRGNIAKAAFMADGPAILDYAGPATVPGLWADQRFRHREMVRVRNSRTVRTRPCFPEWSAHVTGTFLPSLMNRSEIITLFKLSGLLGLGDHRPEFGRFLVEESSTE